MKKILALILTMVFAFALCSCSGSSSSEGESSITSTGILGKWDLDSYESDTSRTPGVDFKASMEVFDDCIHSRYPVVPQPDLGAGRKRQIHRDR